MSTKLPPAPSDRAPSDLVSVAPSRGSLQGLPSTTRSLPIALIRAREGVMSPIRDMLSETGITEQQWRVLRVLSEHGVMDTKTLADRSSLLFPSLTRIAATLRDKGLVTQTRDDKDRRRQFIAITPAGQKIIDDRVDQTLRIVADFKATLGAENYETLLDLLAMLDPGARD
ncbi:MAG: homoprotocatechuate degradation operon regulator HpaR [Paracoccaceae bacterium]